MGEIHNDSMKLTGKEYLEILTRSPKCKYIFLYNWRIIQNLRQNFLTIYKTPIPKSTCGEANQVENEGSFAAMQRHFYTGL